MLEKSTNNISKKMKFITKVVDTIIEDIAGEKVDFTLLIYTKGAAQFASTLDPNESIEYLKQLLETWEHDQNSKTLN